mgnify:CR=1 FL=1
MFVNSTAATTYHVDAIDAQGNRFSGDGANVLFDTWVHPLMMGLEEHLIGMFREDFEFHAGAAPSHLGSNRPAAELVAQKSAQAPTADTRT